MGDTGAHCVCMSHTVCASRMWVYGLYICISLGLGMWPSVVLDVNCTCCGLGCTCHGMLRELLPWLCTNSTTIAACCCRCCCCCCCHYVA
jgi:hypothetical protein